MNRRRFLTAAATARVGASASKSVLSCAEISSRQRFRVIDTHMHVFNSDLQGRNGIPHYMPRSTTERQPGSLLVVSELRSPYPRSFPRGAGTRGRAGGRRIQAPASIPRTASRSYCLQVRL